MSLLLDTCVFLWLIGLPERLSPAARVLLTRGDTRITVSTANLWEVLIKLGKGQIGLDSGGASALDFLIEQCAAHRLNVLPIFPGSLEPLERLPSIHRDPFDRVVVALAQAQALTILTSDQNIPRYYGVKTLW